MAQDGQSGSKLTISMCRVRRQNVFLSVVRYRTTHPSENGQRYDGGGGVGNSRAELGRPAVRSNAAFNSWTMTESNARRSSGAPGKRASHAARSTRQSGWKRTITCTAVPRESCPSR